MAEGGARTTWTVDDGFDLDGFLGQPLVARVAAVGRTGPSVRPLWYLWEGRAFWWLTGGWSRLGQLLERDARRMGTSVKMIDRTYGHLVAGADAYERELLDAFDEASGRVGRYLDAESEADAA